MLSLNAYITEALIADKVKKDGVNYVGEYDPEKAIKKFGTVRIEKGDGYGVTGKLFYREESSTPSSKPVPTFCIMPEKNDHYDHLYMNKSVLDNLINAGLGELYVVTRYYEYKDPYQRSGLSSKRFSIYLGTRGEMFNNEKDCKKFITYAKREHLIPKGSGTKCMNLLDAKKFIDEGFSKNVFFNKIYFAGI